MVGWSGPARHHDSCGVGFIAARDLRPSRAVVEHAIEALRRLDHRGAQAVDGTGDGAGMLVPIPREFFRGELAKSGLNLGESQALGVLVSFFSGNVVDSKRLISETVAAEGLTVEKWRSVPQDTSFLGAHAMERAPVIEQAIIVSDLDTEDLDDRLFLVRKKVERLAGDDISIPSASSKTLVYKGLFTARHIADFYPDLRDESFTASFAMFHQRFSTNTFPSWRNAQPFRTLAHNGEINTISANRSWMLARERGAAPGRWGERLNDLFPFLQPEASDSASLDNVFELLLKSGRDLAHVSELLIPSAWENVADMDPTLRAFYEYNAFLTEPWDGPAAITATDGVSLLAAMDRNGLRPARWCLTPEHVLVASEAGVCPAVEAQAITNGQLGPGELIVFDGTSGDMIQSEQVKQMLAGLHPYREWIERETVHIEAPFDNDPDYRFDADSFSRTFAFTTEEKRLILAEMAEGRNPLGSMGNDTGLAALAGVPQRVPRFLHQMFAQVTNPPIDPLRERLMMSTSLQLGARGSILSDQPQQARLIELANPVISEAELKAILSADPEWFANHEIDVTWDASQGTTGLKPRIEAVCADAVHAVNQGTRILVLSDLSVSEARAPVPIALAVGAVHHRLSEAGVRGLVSIVVVSGEPRDAHDVACLIGLGASAINPYLAIEEVRRLAVDGIVSVDPVTAQENYRSQLQEGVVKIMSKMGICTLSAYRGSELFEVVGLADEVCDLAFRNASRRLRGLGFEELAAGTLARHQRFSAGDAEPGGFYKHRSGGDHHITSPKAALGARRAAEAGTTDKWVDFLTVIGDRQPALIRDLVGPRETEPISLADVEPASSILRRFTTAAMSQGALSPEAHETLAMAMNRIGGRSNSGEGGEDPSRYGTLRNSAIKQVASGRFGVTPRYLASAREIQIKMAQGSKPGEGGQLPGFKVTAEIARLRHTEPGVTLISPPPHHDIYSIEDLAQLIYDLKTFAPTAKVSVKLVSEPGIGTIALGVAKAGADIITISGGEGGTGASPLTSIKHAGSPWELGLAETHRVLSEMGMRSSVVLEVDGGIRTGWDVVMAAILGAQRFGFGTLPLVALGCRMVRQCHLNTCPVGVATQDPDLRQKFAGRPEHVVHLFELIAEEVRHHLAQLGLTGLDQASGRSDLLTVRHLSSPLARDVTSMLETTSGEVKHRGYAQFELGKLAHKLSGDVIPELRRGLSFEGSYEIENTDRSLGAHLSGEITREFGELDSARVTLLFRGFAGQSFGAWLCQGVETELEGVANDYLAKGMAGGLIVVKPPKPLRHAAGNAVMYGSTGGMLLVAGRVGQRFAVRNSGGEAVIEGCSDHGCEYMTGGTVVILGSVGRNFGAGMTGGKAFVIDDDGRLMGHLADTAPKARRLLDDEVEVLGDLVRQHLSRTGSVVAGQLLGDGGFEERFKVIDGRSAAP